MKETHQPLPARQPRHSQPDGGSNEFAVLVFVGGFDSTGEVLRAGEIVPPGYCYSISRSHDEMTSSPTSV